jgi:hypothetical protein
MIPLVQMLLNRGEFAGRRLYLESTIDRMEVPATTLAARSGLHYGYGLGLYQYQYRRTSFFGHGGDADGYLAFFAYSKTLKRGYFVVINAFNKNAMLAMRRAIEDNIIAGHEPPRAPQAQHSQAQIERLTGRYGAVTARFGSVSSDTALEVIAAGAKLYLDQKTGQRRRIYPVTAWHFRFASESIATIAFIPCGASMVLQGDFGNYAKPSEAPAAPCPDGADQVVPVTP